MEKSVFETLFEVNVNDHVEKKNVLSYLSWPYAWSEVKNVFQMQITKLEYKTKDEIWLIAKYYSKQQDGKYYKGFIVREIITEQEIQRGARASNSRLKCSEKCSANAREDGNFETFDIRREFYDTKC